MTMTYIVRNEDIVYINEELILTNQQLVDAIIFANNAIKSLDEQTKAFDIHIFEAMGIRNLSGIIGEYLGKSIERVANGNVCSNLHQDGYPDLVLTNNEEKKRIFFFSLYGG